MRLDDEGIPCIPSQPVGGRRSMVDPQIVILVVAGSSPVGHPTLPRANGSGLFASEPLLSECRCCLRFVFVFVRSFYDRSRCLGSVFA